MSIAPFSTVPESKATAGPPNSVPATNPPSPNPAEEAQGHGVTGAAEEEDPESDAEEHKAPDAGIDAGTSSNTTNGSNNKKVDDAAHHLSSRVVYCQSFLAEETGWARGRLPRTHTGRRWQI
jgi:hypothetical protein